MGEQADHLFDAGDEVAGRLVIRRRLGRGGFADVYHAYDPPVHRDIALKVIRQSVLKDDPMRRKRILLEARLIAAVSSPYIVTLYDFLELEDGRVAFVLEYLGGGTLAGRIEREGALDPAEAKRYFHAIVSALAAAHEKDIVHHDVKPANVLIGEQGAIKLTDFGLGRLLSDEDLAEHQTGRARGTPSYMAPEVVMGAPAVPASDLWGAGVILYRMLTGRLPFPARDLPALFYAIQNAMPTPVGRDVSPFLAGLAFRCLAKAPDDRPVSARELLDELEGHKEPMASTPAPTAGPPEPLGVVFGREVELAHLDQLADATAKGHGRTALILGEPGIGKTVLAAEAARRLKARGFHWLETRLSALEGLRGPLIQAIRRGLERQAESSGSGEAGLTPQAETLLQRLQAAEDTDTREALLRSTWEIERAFMILAGNRPLAVLVEDVHLCHSDEIRTLAGLSATLASQNVFLLLTWRTKDPEPSDPDSKSSSGFYDLVALEHLARIELGPIPDEAMREIIESTADCKLIQREIIDRITKDAEGVPLYAVSLYRHLEAAGEIERQDDAVRTTDLWGRSEPPEFIRDMVRRRVTRLTEEDQELLETAAVAGVEFDARVLAELLDKPVLPVLRRLQQLYRNRALIEPLEHSYRFAHALYRDAIYTDLAPDLRKGLHEAWAEALDRKAEKEPVDAALLAAHWESAGRTDRAVPYWRTAAMDAIRRGELERGWEAADRAGVYAEDRTPEQLRKDMSILLSLASSFSTKEGADALEALHARLHAAAAQLSDEEMRRRTDVAIGWHRYFRAGTRGVDAEALQQDAPMIENPIARLEAWWLLGHVHKDEDDHALARRCLEHAMAIAKDQARFDLQSSLHHTEGLLLRREGRLDDALPRFRIASDLRLRASGPAHTAITHGMLAMLIAENGDPAEAAAALVGPIGALERSGQESRAAHVMVVRADMLRDAGRLREAATQLARAEPVILRGDFRQARVALQRALGRDRVLRGDLLGADDALRQLEVDLVDEEDATLFVLRAWGLAAQGDRGCAQDPVLHVLDDLSANRAATSLAPMLLELAALGTVGVPLDGIEAQVREAMGSGPHPTFLALCRDVLRGVLCADDQGALERAAAAASNPCVGFYQADTEVLGLFLLAAAHEKAGLRDQVRADLRAAREGARRQEHVWFELLALRRLRDLGFEPNAEAERSVSRWLREQNPDDPQRASQCLARWLPGSGET